jgi:hypothetical protein
MRKCLLLILLLVCLCASQVGATDPVLSGRSPANGAYWLDNPVTIQFTITDADADTVNATLNVDGTAVQTWSNQPNSTTYTYSSSYSYGATVSWNVTFDDGTTTVYGANQTFVMKNAPASMDTTQFSVVVMLALFMFWFAIGYYSEKRSGGAFMVFSGFMLFYIEVIILPYVSVIFVIPFISPLAIFIILLGLKKFLYTESKENKRKAD